MPARRIAALAVGLVLAACTLAGCRSQGDDPPPSPTPTYECTAPDSCTPQQAAKEQQASKDHAAAEKALRASQKEANRLFRAGGADKPTVGLKRVATGNDLRTMMNLMRDFKKKRRVGHGSIKLPVIRFKTPYPDDTQQLFVCEDGTDFFTTDRKGKDRTGHGIYQTYTVTMKFTDGTWKRADTSEGTKVKTCQT